MVSKKRLFFLGVVFLLVISLGVYAYTKILNPGHGADEVLILVNGFSMTLQEAIDYGFLLDCGIEPTKSYSTSGDHIANEILVNIQAYTSSQNLQEVLSNNLSLCGNYCVNRYDSSLSECTYTLNKPNPGHFANEILVSINGEEMTFQKAISEGKFCPILHYSYGCSGDDVYWYNSCGEREEVKEECGDCELVNNCCCLVQSPVSPHGSEMKMYQGYRCVGGNCAYYYSCGNSCGSPSSLPYECSGTPSSCMGWW